MALPDVFVELRERNAIGWVRRDLADLGLAAFWGPLQPLPFAKGRGGVGCLGVAGLQLVVRPYQRGGAFGSLLADRYAGPRRARAELAVLEALRSEGVPVVTPIAAVARRGRAFWRLRLCTEQLPDALPVPGFLAAFPQLRRHAADAVGTVVRLAFAAGLRHPDLHPDNLLCSSRGDKVRVVLVDLDRARVKKPLVEGHRDEMLVRMQRYVIRHRDRLAAVPTRAETMRFLRALGLDRDGRHEAWRRLANKLAVALRRRGWLRR
ncbi:MAG: lipopolysaccharide kinase InaA family protein [Planctomycetota bacterium]